MLFETPSRCCVLGGEGIVTLYHLEGTTIVKEGVYFSWRRGIPICYI